MAWIGWDVEAVDWELDKGMDLTEPEVQQKYLKLASKAKVSLVATPCDTLSKIRNKPIPGHPNPPLPLRNADHIWGLPGLGDRDRKKAEDGNKLVEFSLQYAEKVDEAGNGVLLETPLNSWFHQFPRKKKLVARSNWVQLQ